MTRVEELIDAIRLNKKMDKRAKEFIIWSNNGRLIGEYYKDYLEIIYNSLEYNSSMIARFMGWAIKPINLNDNELIELIKKGSTINVFSPERKHYNRYEVKAGLILGQKIIDLDDDNEDFFINLKHIIALLYDFNPANIKLQDSSAMLANLLIKLSTDEVISLINNGSDKKCNNLLFNFTGKMPEMPELWYKFLLEALKVRFYCYSEIELINKFKENNLEYNSKDCLNLLINNNYFFNKEIIK